jgi:hypothetical protein
MGSVAGAKHTPPEERFRELFEAARALFKAGEAEEDVVFPTLVFANEIGQNPVDAAAKERLVAAWDSGKAWQEETDNFAREHKGFAPVRVVERALFLELRPVLAEIRSHQNTNVPKEVEIRVQPRRVPASREQVATAYEEVLSDAGIPCEDSDCVSLDSEFRKGVLWMLVKHAEEVLEGDVPVVLPGRKPRFPHPRLIGAHYNALYSKPRQGKGGYARLLKTRKAGGEMQIYNLLPACAALFLRHYGKLKQGEVHNLLNKNMLRDWHPQGEIPEMKDDPASHHSRKSQLWDDVDKVKEKLFNIAYVLFYHGK